MAYYGTQQNSSTRTTAGIFRGRTSPMSWMRRRSLILEHLQRSRTKSLRPGVREHERTQLWHKKRVIEAPKIWLGIQNHGSQRSYKNFIAWKTHWYKRNWYCFELSSIKLEPMIHLKDSETARTPGDSTSCWHHWRGGHPGDSLRSAIPTNGYWKSQLWGSFNPEWTSMNMSIASDQTIRPVGWYHNRSSKKSPWNYRRVMAWNFLQESWCFGGVFRSPKSIQAQAGWNSFIQMSSSRDAAGAVAAMFFWGVCLIVPHEWLMLIVVDCCWLLLFFWSQAWCQCLQK